MNYFEQTANVMDSIFEGFTGEKHAYSKLFKCEKCDGTGIVLVANGADDYDKEVCECKKI